MSKKYSKKHQKVVFIITIVLCVAVLAATLLVTVSSYLNTSPMFNDQDFAKALAEQLDVNARSLTPEMLEQYEYIRITASFTTPHTGQRRVRRADHQRGLRRGGRVGGGDEREQQRILCGKL